MNVCRLQLSHRSKWGSSRRGVHSVNCFVQRSMGKKINRTWNDLNVCMMRIRIAETRDPIYDLSVHVSGLHCFMQDMQQACIHISVLKNMFSPKYTICSWFLHIVFAYEMF